MSTLHYYCYYYYYYCYYCYYYYYCYYLRGGERRRQRRPGNRRRGRATVSAALGRRARLERQRCLAVVSKSISK